MFIGRWDLCQAVATPGANFPGLRPSKTALPSSPFGKALTYAKNHELALSRYLEDGRLQIDNNAMERDLRPIAIGRKNWIQVGSLEGGERAAVFFTLVSSCKGIGVDPFEYLRDVIERIPTHPNRRLHELTPIAWKAAREQAAQERLAEAAPEPCAVAPT